MKNQSSHQNRQPIKHGTTPPRIFIAIQYLEIGGAERSLIGLLNALDYSRCQVDLFVYRHSGEFMNLIPKEVNLLPEVKKYTTLTRLSGKLSAKGIGTLLPGASQHTFWTGVTGNGGRQKKVRPYFNM